jgi:superfamily I DNA/RNA helicase
MRNLINEDGSVFESSELYTLRNELDALDNDERIRYRDLNASSIAQHSAVKFLIVSGPGTGKSHLFLERINYWFQKDAQAKVFVTTFVRKLVTDLKNDIDIDNQLTSEQKENIIASTLHKFARSVVERNHGTVEWPFLPHFSIIGQFWKDVVWEDALSFYQQIDGDFYSWKKFEQQLHDARFEETDPWQNLENIYSELCKFYNAAGFADLIIRAKDALTENPELIEWNYFIIDEYQDFNQAEDELINKLANDPSGLLVVGDDEQVLYEKLKSGKPTLIRNIYRNNDFVNGMLPFCGRCGFHITRTADHFIQHNREADCIEKIYLPIKTSDENPKVQVIACPTAGTAVDYIQKFVKENKEAIDERKALLASGEEKDAFLLILTPAREVNFYGKSKETLFDLTMEYKVETRDYSEDYYKILAYYSLAKNPQNNFLFRKVLYYENVAIDRVQELIKSSLQSHQNFNDLDVELIQRLVRKSNEIKAIIDDKVLSIDQKIENLNKYIEISDRDQLKKDIEGSPINPEEVAEVERKEEENAELEEIEVKKMGAIELMTIVGSKGLSADHVIIIGFDNVNMHWVTKNAFYVAMTRARKTLHILTALKSGGARQSHGFVDYLPSEHTQYYKYKKSNHTKTLLRGKQHFIDYLNYLNLISGTRR